MASNQMSFIFILLAYSDHIFMCVTHRWSVRKTNPNPMHTQHPVIEQLCGFYIYVGNMWGSLSQNFLSLH